MKDDKKTIEIKVARTIPAPVGEVFDGWLNPKIPGNPWNAAEKFILNPKVDGLFYWTSEERPITGGSQSSSVRVECNIPGCLQTPWEKNRR